MRLQELERLAVQLIAFITSPSPQRHPRPFPPQSLSATTTTTTTNAPLGGNLGCFPPFLTAAPLPLLLQNRLAAECQCHCRQ